MVRLFTIILIIIQLILIVNSYYDGWVETTAPSASWFAINSDSSGLNLAAIQSSGGYIYTSSDGRI
jgi:hypothetical protein